MPNRANQDVLRAISLSNEIDTATEQISMGANHFTNAGWSSSQPGAAFTSLAVGVERVLKLTIGESVRHSTGTFPAGWNRNGSGHDLLGLYSLAIEMLSSAAEVEGTPYMRGLIDDLKLDLNWTDILIALSRWAAPSGRYAELDNLAGRPAHTPSVAERWEVAEHRLITDAGGWASFEEATIKAARLELARSLLSWWHVFFRGWQNGLVGDRAKQFSSALNPATCRHLRPDLRALIMGK